MLGLVTLQIGKSVENKNEKRINQNSGYQTFWLIGCSQ